MEKLLKLGDELGNVAFMNKAKTAALEYRSKSQVFSKPVAPKTFLLASDIGRFSRSNPVTADFELHVSSGCTLKAGRPQRTHRHYSARSIESRCSILPLHDLLPTPSAFTSSSIPHSRSDTRTHIPF
jgi:hypothetical protein